MMKYKILFLLSGLVFSQLQAQESLIEDTLRQSAPPNTQPSIENMLRQFALQPVEPTTASLGRYGEYRMNYSSGLPDISIPLYEINSGDLTVPIVLRYQGGGIKIQQEATWVGLGWDLFYGGQVTRVVQGFPDEKEPSKTNRPTASEIQTYLETHANKAYDTYLNNMASGLHASYSYMPDEYYYNVGMENGKFIGKDVEALVPHKSVKINQHTTGWNITNSEGIKYTFKANETTDNNLQYYLPYTSAWQIDKITSPSNHTITYEYQADGTYINKHRICYDGYNYQHYNHNFHPFAPIYNHPINMGLKESFTIMEVTCKKPQFIYFAGGRVKFVLSSRDDIHYSNSLNHIHKLEAIIVEKLKTDGTYETLKYFQFNYFYKKKRLFLKSISQKSILDNTQRLIARFEYDAMDLPEKDSYAYDYCGYYNRNNKNTPIPSYHIVTSYGNISFGGADKNVVESYTKAGTLVSIEYPTKGKTRFVWENHRYGAEQPVSEKLYSKLKHVSIGGGCPELDCKIPPTPTKDDPPCTGQGWELMFINHVDQDVLFYGTITRHNPGPLDFQHQKYDKGNVILVDRTTQDTLLNKYISQNGTVINEVIYLRKNHQYYAKASTNCYNVGASLSFTYNEYNPDDTDKYNYPYAGLRLKEINNHDKNGQQIEKQKFTYVDPNFPDKSSGYITNTAEVLMHKRIKSAKGISYNTGTTLGGCVYLLTETNLYYDNPITGIYGNNINYQYVQVQKQSLDGRNNGRIEYEFKKHMDEYFIPDLPLISNAHLRGQLLKQRVYNSDNDLLELTVNHYMDHPAIKNESRGFKLKEGTYFNDTWICSSGTDDNFLTVKYRYVPYDYIVRSNWCKLDSTHSYSYLGSNIIEQKTEYVYNNLVNCQPTKITTCLEDGKKKITNLTYPLQITKDIPFETKEEYIDSKLVFKQTNKYTKIPLTLKPIISSYMISLDSILIKYGTGEERTEIKVKRDIKNNIIEYANNNNTPIVYLWGYNFQYPIAEIKNATYDQVVSKIVNGQSTIDAIGSKNDLSAADSLLINSLRSSLPEASITTYTHQTLVGIESKIDPNGKITTYHYDGFNRLQYIKDHNGKIIEDYNYHYQNQ